jgi:hypothetical protein
MNFRASNTYLREGFSLIDDIFKKLDEIKMEINFHGIKKNNQYMRIKHK